MICGFFFFPSNANRMDQPFMANWAWSTRRLNKCDWMAISWYINIYQLMNINMSFKKNLLVIFTRTKTNVFLFSWWFSHGEEKFNFFLIVIFRRKKNCFNFFFLVILIRRIFLWKLFVQLLRVNRENVYEAMPIKWIKQSRQRRGRPDA